MGAFDAAIRLGWQLRGSVYAQIHRQNSTYRAVAWHTAAPTDGTWGAGDFVYNSAGGTSPLGWTCTVAGTPGTWVAVTVGSGGDNVSVNGTACDDANFNDSSPVAPADAANTRWQRDGTATPDDVSSYVRGEDIRALITPAFGYGRGEWKPDNGTNIGSFGLAYIAISGTPSHPQPTTASLRTSLYRWRRATAAAAANSCGERSSNGSTHMHHFWRGNAAGMGGFFTRWGIMHNAINSDSKAFFGFWDTFGTPFGGGTEPDSMTNMFGFGYRSTDTNWHFFHNDGSGTATAVDLGLAKATADQILDFSIHVPSNGSTVGYRVDRRDAAGSVAPTTVSTDIPANTVFMYFLNFLVNSPTGGTAVAASYECDGVMVEYGVGNGVRSFGLF